MEYDIIGDIHGHYEELHALLLKMGYRYDEAANNFIPPPGRQALFIGDYIDGGNNSRKVISLVRNMVNAGHAEAIMGNHDYNAVQWATESPGGSGKFLRPHNEKNMKQHKKFLEEVESDPEFYRGAIEWFRTLPVFQKYGKRKFVHACWYQPAIDELQAAGCLNTDGTLTEKGWLAGADEQSPYFQSIEILLKGPEEDLPQGLSFTDAHGIERRRCRIAWWRENAMTYAEAYTSLPAGTAFARAAYHPAGDSDLSEKIRHELRSMPADEQIFIGHIWETGVPKPMSSRVCCLDYSVAKGGKLVAYRTDEHNPSFSAHNYVAVPSVDAPAAENPLTPAPGAY